jgi:hypothetical protein
MLLLLEELVDVQAFQFHCRSCYDIYIQLNKYMFYRYPCPFIRSVVHNGYHIDYRRRRQDDLARMANEY